MADIARLLFFCVLVATCGSSSAQLFSLLNARIQNHAITSPASATFGSDSVAKPSAIMLSPTEAGNDAGTKSEPLQSSATSRMAFLARMQQVKQEAKDRWTPLPNRHSELLSVQTGAAAASASSTTSTSSSPSVAGNVKSDHLATSSSSSLKAAESSPTKEEIKLYNLNAIAANSQQQFHIGYIKASDLQKVIASGFQLQQLRGRLESTDPAVSSSEPLLAAAAGASGKTSPRKTTDKLRLARLQAVTDTDLQSITQKDISNQPIVKESLKSVGSSRKSPVSPKQAHFGLREKKQRLAQLQAEQGGTKGSSGATASASAAGVKTASAFSGNVPKETPGTKGKSAGKSGRSRKSPTKNLIAARTVPFGSDLFSSTTAGTTANPTTTTLITSTSTTTTTTTTTTTPAPETITLNDLSGGSSSTTSAGTAAGERETNESETPGSTDEETTGPSTDSLADAVARSGKLVLAGITEDEEENDGNNSLAAIAQQLNQNFGGFGYRNTLKSNQSEAAELRSAHLQVDGVKGSSFSGVKGKPSDSISPLKAPSFGKKAVSGAVKGRSRNNDFSGKASRKAPEPFLSTTIGFASGSTASPVSQSATTPTPITVPITTTTSSNQIKVTATATSTTLKTPRGSAGVESADEDDAVSPSDESDSANEDDTEGDQNEEFTLIGANLRARSQADAALLRRNKAKQRGSTQQHSNSAGGANWTGDDALDGDYEGFEDLNEVELLDSNRPSAVLGSLKQESPLQLSGCCSCSPLQSISPPSAAEKPVSIQTAAQQLGAGALFDRLPESGRLLRELVQQLPDTTFTVLLPSSEAVDRLPKALISRLKRRPDELRVVLANHVVSGRRTLATLMHDKVLRSRATRSNKADAAAVLRVNVARNETATVNGQRLLLVDQPVIEPRSRHGWLHLIDGLLYPLADRNLLDTLKACNKFDGFVTLAQGTGLSDVLEQPGPYTVFVPSNDALQKIPDTDLDSIRNNMTALKEFLSYHVVDGAYFSNDLKDGQFLPTLLGENEIQVGVRVDQCQRRLIDANVSPLYRTDIPASNGVIHIVDWILKPSDHDWCENVVLPR